tara:strand:+ start:1799 stop:2434 length:636 start_codon:yes stop_codon:yes gene_type:complete
VKGDIVEIRDRIKELRKVKASELLPNPKNWRKHPDAQANALRGTLSEIGYADALIAYETPNGLMLIDGHLRAETTPEMEVPVLVTDLTEDEADTLLATLDPLSAMARTDEDALLELVSSLNIQNDAVNLMLEAVLEGETQALKDVGATPDLDELSAEYGELDPEMLWAEIKMRVPPEVKDKFDQWLLTGTGETEVERLADLLGSNERILLT